MRTPKKAYEEAFANGSIEAWLLGKRIQHKHYSSGEWMDLESEHPWFVNEEYVWRPAPEPKLRPWKPEEVPKNALYRRKAWALTDPGSWSVILAVSLGKIAYISASLCMDDLNNALEYGEHSTDGGKTWAPCGVMEGGE